MKISLTIPARRQVFDFTCVPATCKMVIDHFTPQNDTLVEELYTLFETDDRGTRLSWAFYVMHGLGYNTHRINFNKVKSQIKNNKPVIVVYKDSPRSDHASLIIGYELHRGCDIFIMNDPFYGGGFKISEGMLEMMKAEYYSIAPVR